MKDLFVTYEQAVQLKELGFDEPCITYYYEDSKTIRTGLSIHINNGWTYSGTKRLETTLAPLKQQVFEWFREKYKLVHEISWSKYKGGLNFDYDIFSLVLPTDDELGDENDMASDKSMEKYDSLVNKDFRWHECDTYEEAENACIDKLIELVKKYSKNI